MLWDPIRYLETCPSSDGACAMVFASERVADRSSKPVAWIHATEMRSEPTMFSGRDQVIPRATLDNAASPDDLREFEGRVRRALPAAAVAYGVFLRRDVLA